MPWSASFSKLGTAFRTPTVFVISDHGFDPFFPSVSMNNMLANAGFDLNKVKAVTSSLGPAITGVEAVLATLAPQFGYAGTTYFDARCANVIYRQISSSADQRES